MTLGHLKQVGEKFKQKAVLHYKGSTKTASIHYLSTSDKPGISEDLARLISINPTTMELRY